MVKVRVLWEPELLDPWKAAWDRLIWKAMILKVKAIEGEPNRNQPAFRPGRSQTEVIVRTAQNISEKLGYRAKGVPI